MTEMVRIRSVKQYFNEFIAEPAQKNGTQWMNHNRVLIKNQVLDAFRREIFGQIMFALGDKAKTMTKNELVEKENAKISNIINQAVRKFRRFCILCSEHGVPFFELDDLKTALDADNGDELISVPDEGEDVTDRIGELVENPEEIVYLDENKVQKEAQEANEPEKKAAE